MSANRRLSAMAMLLILLVGVRELPAVTVVAGSTGNQVRIVVTNSSTRDRMQDPAVFVVHIPSFVQLHGGPVIRGTPRVVPPGAQYEVLLVFDVTQGTAGLSDTLVVDIGSDTESPVERKFPLVVSCSCPCWADPVCDGVKSDVLDVVTCINVAFRGQVAPTDPGCLVERTDVDCSTATDVIDVVKIINVAFRGTNASTEFCNPCP